MAMTFGRLSVIGNSGKRNADGKVLLHCQCECGGEKLATQNDLKRGFVKSCGCLRGKQKRHGMTATKTHIAWKNMLSRCQDEAHPSYKHYGARGIKVCEEWATFENFFADMGEAPVDLTLERKDVNGNYEPSNCIWADRVTQNSNKQYNIRLTCNGKQYKTVTELAADIGVKANTLYHRIKRLGASAALAPYSRA